MLVFYSHLLYSTFGVNFLFVSLKIKYFQGFKNMQFAHLIKMDKTIRNHVIQFGTKEFGEDYIYITTYSNTVYRMKLDDK